MDTAAGIEDLEGLVARLRNPLRYVVSNQLVEKTTVDDMALAADVIERLRGLVSEYAMAELTRLGQELKLP